MGHAVCKTHGEAFSSFVPFLTPADTNGPGAPLHVSGTSPRLKVAVTSFTGGAS